MDQGIDDGHSEEIEMPLVQSLSLGGNTRAAARNFPIAKERDGTSRWVRGVAFASAVISIALIVCLILRRIRYPFSPFDYTAAGELLLVLIIALEGEIAITALRHDQGVARATANNAIFDLYKMYLSVDYHKHVRRPAWFCLSCARRDRDYYTRVLGGLSGELAGDEVEEVYEKARSGGEQSLENQKALAYHDEYHRVLDILEFFAMLAALGQEADKGIFANGRFFYDRWRVQLHMIVRELETYTPDSSAGPAVRSLKELRCEGFRHTLTTLDQWFKFREGDWKDDPQCKILWREKTQSDRH